MKTFPRFFWLQTILIGSLYSAFVIYSMNLALIQKTLFGAFSIDYKTKILYFLLIGAQSSMSQLSLIVLFITAFLTGANLSILILRVRQFGGLKKTHILTGSGSILGILGSGCATCGLSIISLLGLGGSFVYLPLRGTEIAVIAIPLLLLSLYTLSKNTNKNNLLCKTEQ